MIKAWNKIKIHLPVGPFLKRVPKETAGQHVLVICDDALGDLLILSGLFRYLKNQGFLLTLVIRDSWQAFAPLLWANRVIAVNLPQYKNSLSYRIHILNQVRQEKYEWAAASLYPSGINVDILHYSGANCRWACAGEQVLKRRLFWADKTIAGLPLKTTERTLEDILVLAAHYYSGILGHTMDRKEMTPVLDTPRVNIATPQQITAPYIHFISDTADPIRQYNAEKILPVLEEYARARNLKVVVTARQPNKKITNTAHVLNLTGQTTLWELLQLIFHAQAVIGGETGATHLAWIVGKPTVMLCGGGHFGLFRPAAHCQVLSHPMPCFGCSWENCPYLQTPAPCVGDISLQQIQQALSHLN